MTVRLFANYRTMRTYAIINSRSHALTIPPMRSKHCNSMNRKQTNVNRQSQIYHVYANTCNERLNLTIPPLENQ